MTLIIREILSLDTLISFIDCTISAMERLPLRTCSSTMTMAFEAECEFSEFRLVMEVTCSLEAEVSSRDAACSDAPWARDWLEAATWPEANATWPAESANSRAIPASEVHILRTEWKISADR